MLALIETYEDFRTYSAIAAYVATKHPTLSVPTADNAYFYMLLDDEGFIVGGYGLKGHGDNKTIVGLFSIVPGRGSELIEHAIARGGNSLECFDGKLREIYESHGFRVVGRYPFDHNQAPDNWDYERLGMPDYLTMSRA